MQDWAVEVLEQAAVASILGKSRSPTMRRLSLIIADNAFEFAMKAFVEFDSGIIGGKLSYSDWEKNYKGNFEKVVGLVLAEKKGAFDRGRILRYHGTRSDLYHEAKPLTVDPKTCSDYVEEVHKAVTSFFGVAISKEAIAQYENDALTGLGPRATAPTIAYVQGPLGRGESDRQAICAIIQLFKIQHGRSPIWLEVAESLSRSGHPIDGTVLRARTTELRRDKFITRADYSLMSKGRKLAQSVLAAS